MKSSVKHERGKNDLEALLVKGYHYLKENRDWVVGLLCLLTVICLVVVGARKYMIQDTSTLQSQMDNAYYESTNRSLLSGETAPDPAPFENLAKTCKAGEESAIIRISAGEAHMKGGIAAIDARIAASEDASGQAPAAPLVNPNEAFDKAVELLKQVMNAHSLTNTNIKARAVYGQGIIAEYRARIAANDKDVEAQLDQASQLYRLILNQYDKTPYSAPAKERLASLEKPVTAVYYKKIANRYVTLPEPKPAESILPPKSADPLDPKSTEGFKAIDQFSVSGDKPEVKPADTKPAEVKPTDAKPVPANTTVKPDAAPKAPVLPEAKKEGDKK